MKFLEKISKLRNEYPADKCGVRDNALLYGVPDITPPLAEHIIFSPMPDDVMNEMVRNYKREFPKELLTLYRTMNGADLFCTVRMIGKKKFRIALSRFSLYGVPLTYDRKHIEPYSIIVEDLDRPEAIPGGWLMFGSYYRPDNLTERLDLYVDTEGSGVYAVEHENEKCSIYKTWPTVDECLCDIYDLLRNVA